MFDFEPIEPKKKNIDIVCCIDGTKGMRQFVGMLKQNVNVIFYNDLTECYIEANEIITALRVKIIVFRYYGEGEPMTVSRFFEIPKEMELLKKTINSIETYGRSDIPHNGFEALYYAFKSDWINCKNTNQRVVLFTDSDAVDLLERKDYPDYPPYMADLNGLVSFWKGDYKENNSISQRGKNLVIFAPEKSKYRSLEKLLDHVAFYPTNDIGNLDSTEIVKSIVKEPIPF